MKKIDIAFLLIVALLLSPFIVGIIVGFTTEAEIATSCIEAGLEWVDRDCVLRP